MKYIVRLLGILGILWNSFLILLGIHITYIYFSISEGQLAPIGSIAGSGFYIGLASIVVGLLGLIACVALSIPKKWGFTLFYIYTLIFIILSLAEGTILAQALWITIFVLITIFLGFQQKKLFSNLST